MALAPEQVGPAPGSLPAGPSSIHRQCSARPFWFSWLVWRWMVLCWFGDGWFSVGLGMRGLLEILLHRWTRLLVSERSHCVDRFVLGSPRNRQPFMTPFRDDLLNCFLMSPDVAEQFCNLPSGVLLQKIKPAFPAPCPLFSFPPSLRVMGRSWVLRRISGCEQCRPFSLITCLSQTQPFRVAPLGSGRPEGRK